MNSYQRFILDTEIRLFMISESQDIWIKRVYTENGILYECNNKDTLTTFDNTYDVNEWFNENG